MNERKTEDIIREHFKKQKACLKSLIIEEQKSDNPKIEKLLKHASKKGLSSGHPEFIIRTDEYPNLLLVIECKADVRKHKSKSLDNYADYAIDGALLYASFLCKEFDVVAIGVSGTKPSHLRVSHYLSLKGASDYTEFLGTELLSFQDYYSSYIQHPSKFNEDYNSLLAYFQELNNILHSKKVKEAQRSLLVSGILIALKNKPFRSGYEAHNTANQLAEHLVNTIANELSSSNIQKDKIENLKHAFSFIKTHTTLSTNKEFVVGLITDIDNRLNSFIETHKYFDALGQFYIEFLRYANNDKGLGIVLTPPHITELFADLAQVTKDSVVIDTCCGTAGFLISALKRMVADAKGKNQKIAEIKQKQVFGIEFQDDIYALAITNMIIHGDGKSNIYLGDSFKMLDQLKQTLPTHPNVGLLNPPYKVEKGDIEELEFVLNNLAYLDQNGTCVAIVPMSCATAQSGTGLALKEKLLQSHTLEAVMSMPEELFHNSNVGTVTCAMVFTAHVPHANSNKKTWFGYFRKDGFIKRKDLGRVDYYGTWQNTKQRWVDAYVNRETIDGLCLSKKVTASDEWCAEAYMVTDYSKITPEDYEISVKKYLLHVLLASTPQNDKDETSDS